MQARQGLKVGKCMLFFGARYKQEPRKEYSVHALVHSLLFCRSGSTEKSLRATRRRVSCKCTRPSRESRLVRSLLPCCALHVAVMKS